MEIRIANRRGASLCAKVNATRQSKGIWASRPLLLQKLLSLRGEEVRCQVHLIGWNTLHLQEIPKGEIVLGSLLQQQIIRGFAIQAWSGSTVNMVHQK